MYVTWLYRQGLPGPQQVSASAACHVQRTAKYPVDLLRLGVEVRFTAFDHRNGPVTVELGDHLRLVGGDLDSRCWMLAQQFRLVGRDLLVGHGIPRSPLHP